MTLNKRYIVYYVYNTPIKHIHSCKSGHFRLYQAKNIINNSKHQKWNIDFLQANI